MVITSNGATKPLLNASTEAIQRAVGGEFETAPLMFSPKDGGFYAFIICKNINPPKVRNFVASCLLGFPIYGDIVIVQPTIAGLWETLEPNFYNLIQKRVYEINQTQERYNMTVYSRKEVMKLLGISAPFFTKLIESGALTASVVGSKYLITEEAIKKYLDSTITNGIQEPRNPKLRKAKKND